MTEKEFQKSDLIPALHKIFSGADTERISDIHEILKRLDITAEKDLVYIDVEKFKHEKILSDVEVSKIVTFLEENHKEQFHKNLQTMELEKSKSLTWVLKQIFFNTPDERLAEIEDILKKELIYSGQDMKIVDTNTLQKKTSLADIEILKIEEYIKTNNRERYDEIKAAKKAEDEIKYARLKKEDEIKYYALKKTEELKFAQEEQKMIECKEDREKELMVTKAKIEMDSENMKMERENELRKEIKKEEMEKVKFEWKKKMELREAKAKEETEREKMKTQREKELIEAHSKEEMAREKINMQKEINEKCYESLLNEKQDLLDDVQDLENQCIQLKRVIKENSKTGIRGIFANNSAELRRAQCELEERKISIERKISRIAELNKDLIARAFI